MKKAIFSTLLTIVFLTVSTLSTFAAVTTNLDTPLNSSGVPRFSSNFDPRFMMPPQTTQYLSDVTIDWPDCAVEVSAPAASEEKCLTTGSTFQIIVNAVTKLVCANGQTITATVDLQGNSSYQGKTRITQVSKTYDAAMKAYVFEMKVDSVDADDPHYIAKVTCSFGTTLIASKEMKLCMKTESSSAAASALFGAGTATTSSEEVGNRRLSGSDSGSLAVVAIGVIGVERDSSQNVAASDASGSEASDSDTAINASSTTSNAASSTTSSETSNTAGASAASDAQNPNAFEVIFLKIITAFLTLLKTLFRQ